MPKTKILLITSRLDMGGGPKHVFELSKRLKTFEISLAAPTDQPFYSKIKPHINHFFKLPHRSFSPLSFISLLMWIKKNNINIIHSHGFGAGIYSRLLALFGLTIIHTMHGCHRPDSLVSSLKLAFEKTFSKLTTKFIFISKDEQTQAKELNIIGNTSFELINNGVDLNDYSSIEISNKVLGTLSRLDPHKNILGLLKMFKKLVSVAPDYQLKIAGDGKQKKELETYIQRENLSNKVILLGEVSSPQEFLDSIEFYVSNSRSEGLPYSVLEAMASRKKIILSNVPGHNSLVDSKCLFRNTNEFLNIIQNFDLNTIESNYSKLEKNYNLLKNINKYITVYQSIEA